MPASFSVNVKTIQVTADAKSKHYGDTDPTLTYQVTGLVGTDAFTGSLTRVAGEEIDSYAINQGDLSAGGNYLINFTPGTFAVTRRPLTVTAVDVTKVYDGQPSGFNVSYAGFAPEEDASVLAGTLTFSGDAVGATSARVYTIIPSGLSSGNYQIAFVPGQLSIQPQALTVTADDQQKTYDGALFDGFTASYSGFVSGEDEGVLGGALSFAGDAVSLASAGSHEIVPEGLTASNYAISFVSGTLTIDKRPMTVTASDQSKIYGDADPVLTYSLTTGELVGSDSLSGSPTRAAGEGVGEYAIQIGSVQISDNYAISFVQGKLTVTEREIAILADAKSKTYGDPDPVFTYQVTSGTLVGGDSFSGALSRAAGTAVGSYQIGLGSLTAGDNYHVSLTPANLVISVKELTVTAGDQSKTYGDEDPALTYHVAGLVSGDSCSGALQRQAGETVGLYPISQGSLTASANYTISFVAGELAITPRPLTVTAVTRSKQYDGSPYSGFTVSYDGFATGDGPAVLTGTPTFGGQALTATNAGSHELTVTGLTGANYTITYQPGILTISPRPLQVTADDQSKTYGEADPVLSYRITTGSLCGSDSLSGELSRAGDEQAGDYAILQGSLAADSNYALSYREGRLTIAKRAVTVTADATSKVYGEADPVFTYQVTAGSLAGADALGGSLSRAAGENVGSYEITQGSLVAGDNYALTYQPALLIVSQRSLTVTADAKGKTYGESDPALTHQVTAGALVSGDGFSGALARAAGDDVGTYEIAQGTLTAGGNYQLTFSEGIFSISPLAITVTADAKSKAYGDDDPGFTYALTSGLLVGGDTFSGSPSREAGEGVGSYTIVQGSLTAGGNYLLTYQPASLAIAPRELTVIGLTAADKVYDADNGAVLHFGQAELQNTVSGDSVSLVTTHALGSFSDKAVGSNRSVVVSGLALSGTDADNYVLQPYSTSATITPKPISVVGITARNRDFDGTRVVRLETANAALTGVVAEDEVTLVLSGVTGMMATSRVGYDKDVTVTGFALTGSDADNYTVSEYHTTVDVWKEKDVSPPPPNPGADDSGAQIIVNGETQDDSATATTTTEGDTTVTTVVIDPNRLTERLQQGGNNATVIVPVSTGADVVVGELNGQMVKEMESRAAVLEVKTERVTYTLPASQINIDNVAAQIGQSVSLQDVKVSVQVAEPAADTVRIVEDTANRNSYQVVVKPVEFSITCTHEDKTVEVSKFNGYVERTVAIPEGIDPSKITTGVVLNADGTFSHVPTTIVMIDGKYYAKINSLTNSVYSVIWNPIEFQDMNGHWAKGPVNDMGSRLVMEGDSSEAFGPNRAITRGEFAATIVKALGLRPATGDSPFVDLQAGDQYYGHILTAYQYGIMTGLPGNKFGADTELTRQEAMAIVVSAMRLTELSSALSSAEVDAALETYADNAGVSSWARNVVAACLKSGIIGGRPGQLIAPRDMITRAEAASIMQRFLRQAALI